MTQIGVNDSDLARDLKVAPITVGRWVRGLREPSFEDLDKIAASLTRLGGEKVIVQQLFQDPTEHLSVKMDVRLAQKVIAAFVEKHENT